MRLRVQYTAQLRAAVGRAEEEIDVPEGSNLAELLLRVASEMCRDAAGYLLAPGGELQPSLLVAVNDRAISTSEAVTVPINSGDVVTLMPPIAGG